MSEISANYQRRADDFEATIVATPADRWASPSPCEHWLARDIVAHVVEYTEYVLHGGEHKPTSPAPSGFDPLAAFRACRVDMQRVLDDPGTTPERAEELDAAVSLDLPQHRWDLTMATGQDATMDAADLDTLWTAVSGQPPEWWEFMRTPGKFGPGIEVYGPEVPVPTDAPRQDRLLGLLGRDPRVDAPVSKLPKDDVMTLPALEGCPGAEHLEWMLEQWSPGAPAGDPSAILDHLALAEGPPPEALAGWWHETASSDAAVDEVLGWRTTRFGKQVVTYRALDGREYDVVTSVDHDTGLLLGSPPARASHGVDIGATPINDLAPDDRAALHAVFAAGFRDADATSLDRRLGGLQTVAMGWRDDELLGFSAVGMRQAELPYIGHRSFLDCGITCIDPSAHNLGLSNAIGGAAMFANPHDLENEFALLSFATPVTLRAAFRFGRATWPGTTISEVAASLASPTRCQRAVGAALADIIGALSYDADHWVTRSGHPLGESVAEPSDLEPEYSRIFEHVDPRRGESLLGVYWWNDPPPDWWT